MLYLFPELENELKAVMIKRQPIKLRHFGLESLAPIVSEDDMEENVLDEEVLNEMFAGLRDQLRDFMNSYSQGIKVGNK